MKRQRLAAVLGKTGLRPILAKFLPATGILGLNYHRIGDAGATRLDRDLWSACEEAFDEQLAFLKRHCDVITPDQIDDARRDRRGVHVLVTFDDGYRDNYELAFRALRRHGVPATFFIATGFVDNPRLPWWDEISAIVGSTSLDVLRLEPWFPEPLPIGEPAARHAARRALLAAYKRLPGTDAAAMLDRLRETAGVDARGLADTLWMTWDMLREMAGNGMTIGGHTVNHVILSRVPEEEQWQEISGCARRLEAELGTSMRYFAYPVGKRTSFDAATVACLERIGVRYAFTYYGGFAGADANPYDMPRMAIEPHVDRDWFRAMLQVPRVFCRAA
ncbi:MAG TPA: polysaccharide deacetylase family protein [Rhodanobacteraceae bacterium]|nr:polysaccharide deacetylase family protein [Rhodanobacteraceae bacterium]